jgi:excisionase family DNA binding protein
MEKLLGIKEVASILNVTKQTLRNWDKEAKLTPIKTAGGHRRYKESDIKKLLNEINIITISTKEIEEIISRRKNININDVKSQYPWVNFCIRHLAHGFELIKCCNSTQFDNIKCLIKQKEYVDSKEMQGILTKMRLDSHFPTGYGNKKRQ